RPLNHLLRDAGMLAVVSEGDAGGGLAHGLDLVERGPGGDLAAGGDAGRAGVLAQHVAVGVVAVARARDTEHRAGNAAHRVRVSAVVAVGPDVGLGGDVADLVVGDALGDAVCGAVR